MCELDLRCVCEGEKRKRDSQRKLQFFMNKDHQSRTVILLFAPVLTTEVDDKLTTIIEREMER